MELEKIAQIEHATWANRKELLRLGIAMLFIVGIMLFVGSTNAEVSHMLIIAAMIGGYMAMNIGANDVANNVGPAVGSRAMTLAGVILIAAIFEALGALVSTTHSIVGGVLGAGIAAGGWDIANWAKMAQIAASWVISPVLGGIIAASFLYLIKRSALLKIRQHGLSRCLPRHYLQQFSSLLFTA
ncbi:MAG: inorganic phosphate transporter [Candidatus Thiodiazotropha sp. LLP2]